MKKDIFTSASLLFTSILTVTAGNNYIKELTFPADADSATKIEMAARLVPSATQRAWQNRNLTAFLHFGMNTFTGREWGDGKESPETFNPSDLDTDQWVSTLKDAGFEMVILTAKHHDGFCLWPTATTQHSVKNSPWLDGQGDVVGQLRRSCDKYGMKLGIYLSPWDRNSPLYGDSPRYNDQFVAQLSELLTNYGKIDEVWFDGACGEGPNGKKQEYDWLRFRETMRQLQPEAVLAITGDDVRWVGNEGGVGRETEWSVTPLVPGIFAFADSVNTALGIDAMSTDIGSRSLIAKADRLYWWPSEVDVSIRPGWFYHDNEKPHSLKKMAEIYLASVGRNSVLLLNIPPDTRGRIADADVERLMEFRHWIDSNFSDNRLGRKGATINTVVLEEPADSGQRVEAFDIEVLTTDAGWRKVASGTTIGNKRILTFPPVAADDIRLTVTSSRSLPNARISGTYLIRMPEEETVKEKTAYTPVKPRTAAQLFRPGKSHMMKFSEPQTLIGFTYTPRPGDGRSLLFKYSVMVSDNGKDWSQLPLHGEFGNIEANPIPQTVIFPEPVTTRYISFIINQSTTGTAAPNLVSDITLLGPAE